MTYQEGLLSGFTPKVSTVKPHQQVGREQAKEARVSAVHLQVDVWEVSPQIPLRKRGVSAHSHPRALGKRTTAPLPAQHNGKLHLRV